MSLSDVNPLLPLCAGSIAGVVGIGTAYPFDAIKTKLQTYASEEEKEAEGEVRQGKRQLSMIDMSKLVFEREGLKGFYGGVYGVMFGEAFVKATLFGSNAYALDQIKFLEIPTFVQLCIASAFSGFVSSFVLNPIERVKILMQADKNEIYKSEIDCILKTSKSDGIFGLLFRGLDGMMAREIPGCVVYFVAYSTLKNSVFGTITGSFAPFLCGGAAGVLAWIPIYPADVIKT